MTRVHTETTKLSKDELKILLHAYIRDQTADQLLDRYTKEDAERFISLREKLIVMLEISES